MAQSVDVGPAVPASLADNLCWLLSQASHVLKTEQTAALEGVGLSPREHMVLQVALMGEFTQTELARLAGLDKTTMVVTLDQLEFAGLAERRLAPNDRRARIVAVTEEGERKVREAEEIGDRIRDEVLSALEPEARQPFLEALCTLVNGPLAEPAVCSHSPRR